MHAQPPPGKFLAVRQTREYALDDIDRRCEAHVAALGQHRVPALGKLHDELVKQVANLRVGYGLDETTQMGTVVSQQAKERIENMIQTPEGPAIVVNGTEFRIDARTTTVVTKNGLAVTGTIADLAIGNDVVYGLAAGVWTQNIRRAITVSERLQAGTVWVNTYRTNSYMSPFGGYKRSGFGREGGQDMIHDYLQTKSVWISTATDTPNPFIQR